MSENKLKQDIPAISVIIITWNRKNDVIEMLRSLIEQTFTNFEVIVVDQASVDETSENVGILFPHVRIIRLDHNHGVAGGRNIGIQHARSEIMVFLDDDAVLEKNGLASVWEEFSSEKNIGIIAGKVVDYYTGELQRAHWSYPDYQITKSDTRFETYTFSGGIHAVRKKVFEHVGQYDEMIFFGPEEYGLSMRTFAAGFKIIYLPTFILRHKGRARLGWGVERWRLFVEGKIFLMILYCPFPIMFYVILEYALGYLIQAIRNFFLFAYFKTIIRVFLKLPILIRYRNPIDINAFNGFRKLEQLQRGPIAYRIRNELFRTRQQNESILKK